MPKPPITHQGKPIPWIVPWTGELGEPDHAITIEDPAIGRARLAYLDERPKDFTHGVLWSRTRERRTGKPLLADIHAGRQRDCMLNPRCQVCGTPLPDENTPWLLFNKAWPRFTGGTANVTTTAPTCQECWPISRARCEAIKDEGVVGLIVGRVEFAGVTATIYEPDNQGVLMPVVTDYLMALEDARKIPYLIADLAAVILHDPKRVD